MTTDSSKLAIFLYFVQVTIVCMTPKSSKLVIKCCIFVQVLKRFQFCILTVLSVVHNCNIIVIATKQMVVKRQNILTLNIKMIVIMFKKDLSFDTLALSYWNLVCVVI